MLAQIGLVIVTLGIYVIYWYYQTAMELKQLADDRFAEPGLWTILLFVPFGALYSHYKYAGLYELVSRDRLNRWWLWIFWIIFPPAVWLIVQSDLNRRATYGWS
jgi:hypothetical protein